MRRQRGVTLIGWLILLIPFALVVYAGIRLLPVYLNYLDVAHTLDQVASEYRSGGGAVSADQIRTSIAKHFEIDEVSYPTVQDITISRNGDRWRLEAAYDDYAPLFASLSLQVQFDKTVSFGSGG